MSSLTQPLPELAPFPVRRFTVDEYHRMMQTNILTENDSLELLEGWIVPKMPHNPPHDSIIDQNQEVLRNLVPAEWRIRVQSAITTADSEPEPDLVLARGPATRYRERHPGPADIALLVEVSDSTLLHDRNVKGRLYARAGIRLYWIINLVDSILEVYSEAAGVNSPLGYLKHQDFGLEDVVSFDIEGMTFTLAVRQLF